VLETLTAALGTFQRRFQPQPQPGQQHQQPPQQQQPRQPPPQDQPPPT
jgi:hypothetical protein